MAALGEFTNNVLINDYGKIATDSLDSFLAALSGDEHLIGIVCVVSIAFDEVLVRTITIV